MKFFSIVGARPQFVKAAILSKKLRQHGEEILVHTGQHYDDNMSQVFFNDLQIPRPDIHLGIGGGSHAEQTGKMLIEVENVLKKEGPDWCIVYGDTNSTLAGALAASKLHIPVAHVEAGLRSFNKRMPEEINRVLCDHIANALFCPSENSAYLLNKEGITQGVYIVGDVMLELFNRSKALSKKKSTILSGLQLQPKSYNLVTIHRASNTDNVNNLRSLFTTLAKLDQLFVFPMHPRTRGIVNKMRLQIPSNIHAIDPVGYYDILELESNANAILTDSGGIQKEAYWAGVRCITLREETEWVETVEAGWNRIVGINQDLIIDAVLNWFPKGERPNIYGDGHASDKISDLLINMTN